MCSFISCASLSFPLVMSWEPFPGLPTSFPHLLNYLSTHFIISGSTWNADLSKSKMSPGLIKMFQDSCYLSARSHWALYPKEEAKKSLTNLTVTSSPQINHLEQDCFHLHDSRRVHCVTRNWHVLITLSDLPLINSYHIKCSTPLYWKQWSGLIAYVA